MRLLMKPPDETIRRNLEPLSLALTIRTLIKVS